MPTPLPDPDAMLRRLLTSIAIQAAERLRSIAVSQVRHLTPIRPCVENAINSLEFPALNRPVSDRAYEVFLSSPEVVGAVDRLLAFQALAHEFPHRDMVPSTPLAFEGTPKTAEDAEYRDRLQREVAEVRRQQHAILEATSYEAQSDALRRECARIVELSFAPRILSDAFVDSVYRTLVAVSKTAYTSVGSLADESPTIRSHLRQRLASVGPRLRLLDSITSVEPYLDFETKLRRQAAAHHRWLAAPHLGREVRVNRTEAYIEPRFGPVSDENPLATPAAEVLASIDRTVVVGDPGAGKSSFGGAACFQAAAHYEARPVGGRLLTPMFVTLRHYASEPQTRSVAEHLEVVANTVYQISPPAGALGYLLTQGRILVVFDGLDELLEVDERRRMRDALEGFCNVFPMTRVLVTARTFGYEHAALSDEFQRHTLLEFDELQTAAYSHGWFALQTDLPREQRAKQAQAFLRESEQHARDLRRNPLLLALLCGVYRGEGALPASRPAIYQRCVDLLLRQWDALRQIKVDEPLGEHLERTLREVAHWAYEDPELAYGIPESRLLRRCTHLIAAMRTEDTDEAARIARSFIDFCRDRAWVLVEIGHDEDGEPLFAFAHRTFLEFFAAQHLEKRSRTPIDLAAALRAMIGGSTSVVPHLALQLANAARDDAGDEIVRYLLNAVDEEEDEDALSVVLFVVDALRFITPRPGTTRWIGREIATGLIKPLVQDTTRYDGAVDRLIPWPRVVAALAAISERNIRAAVSGFSEGLSKCRRPEDRRYAIDVLDEAVRQQPEYLAAAWQAACRDILLEGPA